MARKLLLADDSITIQKVVELVLAEEGFEIKAVNNGEEALAALAGFKPDVVLADVEMPKINGYQLCEKLKTNPATKGVPVILLSGAFEPLDEELAKQVKADSFVVKPFESQELISKINAALVSSRPMAGEAVAAEEEEAVVSEAAAGEEDLWAMEVAEEVPAGAGIGEDISAEPVTEEFGFPETVETTEEEEVDIAEAFEAVTNAFAVAEQKPAAATFAGAKQTEKIAPPVAPSFQQKAVSAPEISLPSKEELALIFKKTVNESIASFFSKSDIKNAAFASMTPLLKDSIEKILWEVTPELTERLLKEMLQGSLASLSKEVEKVIWETVPEIAERIIAKEIEKIRSES